MSKATDAQGQAGESEDDMTLGLGMCGANLQQKKALALRHERRNEFSYSFPLRFTEFCARGEMIFISKLDVRNNDRENDRPRGKKSNGIHLSSFIFHFP